MSARLVIDKESCIGCKACEAACAYGALIVADGFPVQGDGCIYCGLCRDACPAGAISIERDSFEGGSLSGSGVWVFAETNEDCACRAPELLAAGRSLADEKGCEMTAVAVCEADSGLIEELIANGADRVIYCNRKLVCETDAQGCIDWLCGLIREYEPEIFLVPATAFGRVVAPGVAVRLRTGLTADCTGLSIEEDTGLLLQTRPTFGGNLMATIKCPDARPQMATVRPGVLPAKPSDPNRTAAVTEISFSEVRPAVTLLERLKGDDGPSIREADRLLVLGRGIGSKKNLAVFHELAKRIGAQIACSRPLVEAGYLEYRCQVGQTGVSVAPKLLISIGVSGAIQHLAGMGNAQTVIAINTDPQAPIFSVSDYKIVGDGLEIAKALIEEIDNRDKTG